MNTRSISWTAFLFTLCAAGCSSSSSGNGSLDGGFWTSIDGGTEGGVVESDGGIVVGGKLSLTADASTSPVSTLDGLSASSGNGFVVVALTLANLGTARPLSTNPALFSLRTDSALVISVSPAQSSHPCNPSFSVAVGGKVSCSVAFEVPLDQKPAALLYDDLQGNKATAPVPPPPELPASDACAETTEWLSSTSSACTACMDDAFSGSCNPQGTSYENSCQACGQSCAQTSDFCACERKCDSASCQSLFEAFNECLVAACKGSCP